MNSLTQAVEKIKSFFGRDWGNIADELLGFPHKRQKGNKEWVYLCPLHQERSPSFGFDIAEGVYHCFGCQAGGDALDLWAKLRCAGNLKDAAHQIAETFGISIEEDGKPIRFTVKAYAQAKGLEVEKLKEWGLRDGRTGVEIPYFGEQGEELAVRTRSALRGQNRFRWRKGDKPIPYGLWQLQNYSRERLFLVEGESDCHTLWQAELPALGLPGKETFKSNWVGYVKSFKELVIIQEPGARGAVLTIASKIAAQSKDIDLYALKLPAKDVSNLHQSSQRKGEDFRQTWTEVCRDKERISFNQPKIKAEWRCYNQELVAYRGKLFRLPYPYLRESDKVWRLEPQQRGLKFNPVAPRLVIIGARYRDEQGRIWTEVCWKDDENRGWESRLIERHTALDRKTLIELAEWGAPVNSVSVSGLVQFLAAFEEENRGQLKPGRASTRMGWIRWQSSPVFLVGEHAIGGNCKFIPRGSEEQRLSGAYKPQGEKAKWIELWEKLPSPQTRFITAAHLAAPLIRLLGDRSALLYIYGETRIGKTALLHLGLSAWGNPKKLLGTAYSTVVGMERRAALYSDLPLAIDERQSAINERFLNSLVYMLSAGQGKLRGQKRGGLDAVAQWRTLAVLSGEEELTSSPLTGIESRTLQLYLPDLLPEQLSREIYKITAENHGHIGRAFIEHLTKAGSSSLRARVAAFQNRLAQALEGKELGGDKLILLAQIGTAESLLHQELGHSENEGEEIALGDTSVIGSILAKEPRATMAEKARDYVVTWIASFLAELESRSGKDVRDDRAFYEDDGSLWIMTNNFDAALKAGGFTRKRVLADWEANGWIKTKFMGGKTRHTVRRQAGRGRASYIVLLPTALADQRDEFDFQKKEDEPF